MDKEKTDRCQRANKTAIAYPDDAEAPLLHSQPDRGQRNPDGGAIWREGAEQEDPCAGMMKQSRVMVDGFPFQLSLGYRSLQQSPMAPATLTKTKMKKEGMVPDVNTPSHNPQYWCLPPMREDPDTVIPISGGYTFHLVTQGREVGVWKNWTVAKAMVSGYPAAAHKDHDTYASCVVEWQAHCQLGVHPHPVAPSQPVTSQTGKGKGPSRMERGWCSRMQEASDLWIVEVDLCTMYRGINSPSALLQVGEDAPVGLALFGGWVPRGNISVIRRSHASCEDALDDGQEPELLSANDFEVALAFAEGDF
ncbi:hypothetical protein B0H14DRAFT_2607588 [Mycena olivaceomarginata]|nr:hypothetical protein B0H14DRAFT_2607588 [Mycena olivaceomarginata]